MKVFVKCPLVTGIIVVGLLLSIVGFCFRDSVYQEYGEKTAGKPFLSYVFMGVKDGVYPWSGKAETEDVISALSMRNKSDISGETGVELQTVPDETFFNQEDGEEGDRSLSQNDADAIKDISGNTVQSPETEELPLEFTRVEEDYFDDALFIGDSRTQGMLEYGGIEQRAAFYCKTSLTVYDLFQKPLAFIEEDGEKLTLEQALERRQFGKIYLMIGINEMGRGTAESFIEEYANAYLQLRRLQPDAIIFLQGIMRVAGTKNASDPIFNNTNINIRNEMIRLLADQKTVFYIDVNEAVCDGEGNLHGDWTFDQIHLKAKYYQIWKEFLLDHGIVRNG